MAFRLSSTDARRGPSFFFLLVMMVCLACWSHHNYWHVDMMCDAWMMATTMTTTMAPRPTWLAAAAASQSPSRRRRCVVAALAAGAAAGADDTGTTAATATTSATAAATTATATTAATATTTSSELIPRTVLFGNPTYASPSLSPDGRYLAYLAPDGADVLNVFIRPVVAGRRRRDDDDGDDDDIPAAWVPQHGRALAVTKDPKRGIRNFRWADLVTHPGPEGGDNAEQDDGTDMGPGLPRVYTILYLQDNDGDENFHLWAVALSDDVLQQQQHDLAAAEDDDNGQSTTATAAAIPPARDLTPGDNVKASTYFTNKRYPNTLLVSTNERDSTCFDMWRIDNFQSLPVVDGDNSNNNGGSGNNNNDGPTPPFMTRVLDTENPGDVVGWAVDDETFQVRFAQVRNQGDSSTTFRVRPLAAADRREEEDNGWKDLLTLPYGEEGSFVDFCPGGTHGYVTSSLGRDTKALLKVNLETGQTVEEIFADDRCDVGGVVLDEDTKQVRLVSYNVAKRERVFFDPDLEDDYRLLEELGPAGRPEVSVVSRTTDETLWVVAYSRSDGPTEYRLFDQVRKTLTPLFVSRPELLKYRFAPMEDVRIPTRDGLELVGYLTRASAGGEATPLVLKVHGGPWARDYWGFSASDQWFANRGYATLSVNFRGSTGYGKTFLHRGDGEWGVGGMQHDLTDSVRWAVERGIADPDRVCIYGGSYGGYACLAGLTFTPDLYRCGVDIVGPSNVKTLQNSIPSYWGPLRNQMLLKIGDVDGDPDFNRKISPLFHIDQIRAPLLIGQGANDPRVKQAEADQIAFSMRKKGIPVDYCLYPDEGHGFARSENRLDFNGRVELFLKEHLGGRAEDFVKPEGSTARFPLLEDEANERKP